MAETNVRGARDYNIEQEADRGNEGEEVVGCDQREEARRPVGDRKLLEVGKSETKARRLAIDDKVCYGRVRGLFEGRRGELQWPARRKGGR